MPFEVYDLRCFFPLVEARTGAIDDLIENFGLTVEMANAKLSRYEWVDDPKALGFDVKEGNLTAAKLIRCPNYQYEGHRATAFITVTVIVVPDFRKQVGRGPSSMIIDTEIGLQESVDGPVLDFIYHNERPVRDPANAQGEQSRMKAFIDSKSLAELYAIERSGPLSMSKFTQ